MKNENIENGTLLDGVLFEKRVNGVDYTRCFFCGKFFVETYENKELHLFCSKKCEEKDTERNMELIKNIEF